MKYLLAILISLFPYISLAVNFPTQTFDSSEMTVGNLFGKEGGTGWGSAWRNIVGTSCQANTGWFSTTTVVKAGDQSGGMYSNATGGRCVRTFTSPVTTDAQEVQWWWNTTATNARYIVWVANGNIEAASKGMYTLVRNTGQFTVYDNLILTDQGAYSINTWYHVCLKQTPSTEVFVVYFGTAATCGTYSSNYSWLNKDAYIATSTDTLVLQDTGDVTGGSRFVIDEFSDVNAAGAAVTPPTTDQQNWFMILFAPIQRILARYVNFAYAY